MAQTIKKTYFDIQINFLLLWNSVDMMRETDFKVGYSLVCTYIERRSKQMTLNGFFVIELVLSKMARFAKFINSMRSAWKQTIIWSLQLVCVKFC